MRRYLTASAVLLGLGLAGPLTTPARTDPALLLPDMVTITSYLAQAHINRIHGRRLLRFPVPFYNQGRGPLEMRGHREHSSEPMQTRQVVYTSEGGTRPFPSAPSPSTSSITPGTSATSATIAC
jgi:hypothetical protein